jgi:transcriptional regulator with XRE-family HTH domain
LTQGYVSDLESGRRAGTRETLVLIAKHLDVDPDWLIAERDLPLNVS